MDLFQIPSFVPVPSREVMFNLSIISVIIGICLIIVGLILNNKNKKKVQPHGYVSLLGW